MKIAVLGTGVVGTTVADRLIELGHEVTLGSRTADNPKAGTWLAGVPTAAADRAGVGTFADAARGADLVVNATPGHASLDAFATLNPVDLDGTTVLDIANALDFSEGMPPVLAVGGRDSLGEQLQRAFPQAHVVKSLNTMSAHVMVRPSAVPGRHTVFVSGDDPEAKLQVTGLLTSFGWPAEDVLDLGGLDTARGVEAVLPLWLRLAGALDTSSFNFLVVR